ncbi:MAG TPA: SPFH domain-containing protein, partial [Bacteroidota bacterium]|nr:SPFH domain-containing protein [Bacteroidota bacterium]
MLFILCIIIAVVALFTWIGAARKVRQQNQSFKGLSGLAGLGAFAFAVIAAVQCFTIVPAGNVGVQDVFGVVSENTLKSGINFVNPFARIVKFSVQTTEHKETMSVLSREGLTIGLEISALYRLDPDSAASV